MTLPYPDLRFDLHPVRAKSVSWIELFYPCGHTGQILPNTHIRGASDIDLLTFTNKFESTEIQKVREILKKHQGKVTVIEVWASWCSDCVKAMPKLKELQANHPDVDYGRATKGAALALKARVLLYSASPLWNNPSKPEDSLFRGKFDETKWKKAAQAAADVINLNQYELHSNISDLFLTRVNREFIFVHMNQPCSWMTSISIPKNLCPTGRNDKSGCNQVTYNLIKEYEILKDGKAYSIDDAASGYDDQNPYINRDPRFYRDCLFNGSIYQGKVAQLGEAEGGAPNPPHNPVEISGFNTHVHSVKFADWDLVLNFDARDPGKGMSTNQNFPYIRYAEVLLNYAEAMNEAFGPEVDGLGNGKTALWAVN